MREILFRGKRIDTGEWVEGQLWINKSAYRETVHIVLKYGEMLEVIPETVGQYTGLDDKNGVKIFVGDVMSINYDDDDEPGIVVWDAEELEYGIDLGNVQLKMGCHYPNQLEVVGNIHDNPELPEVQSEKS